MEEVCVVVVCVEVWWIPRQGVDRAAHKASRTRDSHWVGSADIDRKLTVHIVIAGKYVATKTKNIQQFVGWRDRPDRSSLLPTPSVVSLLWLCSGMFLLLVKHIYFAISLAVSEHSLLVGGWQ